jgi:Transmembrane domain of unknown function (DUF3566)
VSVDGAEEDGVDNRVEVPSRAPGEGSGSTTPGDNAEEAAPSATTLSPEAALAADAASPVSGSDSASPPPASAGQWNGSLTAPPTAFRQGGSGTGTAPIAAVASGARGLASRVGSSFAGLTKPKPKKPKAPPVRRPASPPRPGGQSSRPQQPSRPMPASQPTRSALLSLQRIEPMSVMKFSFLISLVGWVVLFVAVAVVYFSLSKLGVFAKIEQTVGLVTYNKDHPGANASDWFRASRVLEYTALVCTINAILFTALATVGAALYNLVTSLTGGIEVTLKESD